jgi:hypothetical protein
MNLLSHLKAICELVNPSDETIDDIFFEIQELNSNEFIKISEKLLELIELESKIKILCVTNLHISETADPITIQFSSSLRKLDVDEISNTSLTIIRENSKSSVLERVLGVFQDNELYETHDFISDLLNDQVLFTKQGFYWSISISLSKKLFEIELQNELSSLGVDSAAILFTGRDRFFEFLKNGNSCLLFERATQTKNTIVIAIGGMDTTLAGPFLILIDLWNLEVDKLDKAKAILLDFSVLKQKEDFLLNVISPVVIESFVIPDFFSITLDLENQENSQYISKFNIIKAFNALLAISTHITINQNIGAWRLRVIGSKTIQTDMQLKNDIINFDNQPITDDIRPFLSLYHWIFDDMNQAKISLARRTIALHASTFKDIISDSRRIQLSLEAAYNLYLDETVSEILETRQRFTEYLLEWTSKDIELKMKLRDVISETALGGLGSIIATIIGLATQHFQPQTSSIVLFVVPNAFILFLVLIIYGLQQVDDAIVTYTNHHQKQLDFYEKILGKTYTQQIAGMETPSQIRQKFKGTISNYQKFLVILSGISLLVWLYWLTNGYFTIS